MSTSTCKLTPLPVIDSNSTVLALTVSLYPNPVVISSTVSADADALTAAPLASIIPVIHSSSRSLAAPVLIFLPTGKLTSVAAVIP